MFQPHVVTGGGRGSSLSFPGKITTEDLLKLG